MELRDGSLVVRGLVSRPGAHLTVLPEAELIRDGFDRELREEVRYAEYSNTGYRVFVVPTNRRRFVSRCWMTEVFTVEFYAVDTIVRDGVIVSEVGESLGEGFARVDEHDEEGFYNDYA